MKEKKNLVFIPARGGSKRIPDKNIKLFCGKPLLYYTISFAKACKNVDEIVVSTDSETIKELAEEYGATVIIRPTELATDCSTTASAAKHTLEQYQNKGMVFDTFITLQTTNPLRISGILDEALELFYSNTDCDSVISVTKNKHKLGSIENDIFVPSTYNAGQRSQDIEPLYYENGMLYITRPSLIMEEEILGKKAYPYVINTIFAEIDIDEPEDFQIAELIYTHFKEQFRY